MWMHYEQLHNHNKAKHNKTVCIFFGIYCTSAKLPANLAMVRALHFIHHPVWLCLNSQTLISYQPQQEQIKFQLHPLRACQRWVNIVIADGLMPTATPNHNPNPHPDNLKKASASILRTNPIGVIGVLLPQHWTWCSASPTKILLNNPHVFCCCSMYLIRRLFHSNTI